MADAIICPLADRLTRIILDQIQNEVNLVGCVKKKVGKLTNELKKIRLFLDDAEWQGYKNQNIKDWLRRLEDASYEMDDVLDEWEIAKIHEVPSRPSWLDFKNVLNRHRIGKKIKDVTAKFDGIFKEKDRYELIKSRPPVPSSFFSGSLQGQSTFCVKSDKMDREWAYLLKKVLDSQGPAVHVISMFGLDGIGKTTLAQRIYNDKQVKDDYRWRIWICVSNPLDVAGIAKEIIKEVQGSSPEASQLDILSERLKKCLFQKKFLLVLDDVRTCDDENWQRLKDCLGFGGLGSKVLVTTREETVATTMGTMLHDIHHEVGRLSDEDCWLLLSQIALHDKSPSDRDDFEELGKRIARKCNGLPLAANVLGSLLHFKYTEDEWDVVDCAIWEIEQEQIDVSPHLLLSYNELSSTLKRCFSYCAVFPKDFNIKVEDLIQSWLALGYLGTEEKFEKLGREYFNNLAMLSFFQDFKSGEVNTDIIVECKMQTSVHDFAMFIGNTSDNGGEARCNTCNTSLGSHVKRYRSFFHEGAPRPKICVECMVTFRVLSLTNCGLKSIPKEVELLVNLRYLNFSGNREMKDDNMEVICKLCKLKILNLSGCNLKKIPQDIGKLVKLRNLDLSHNELLEELPNSIYDLQELRILCLEGCFSLWGHPHRIPRLQNLKAKHLKIFWK